MDYFDTVVALKLEAKLAKSEADKLSFEAIRNPTLSWNYLWKFTFCDYFYHIVFDFLSIIQYLIKLFYLFIWLIFSDINKMLNDGVKLGLAGGVLGAALGYLAAKMQVL